MNQVADEASAPSSEDARSSRLSLKEIRSTLGEKYMPIITVEEASTLSRFAVKTIRKKVGQGSFVPYAFPFIPNPSDRPLF